MTRRFRISVVVYIAVVAMMAACKKTERSTSSTTPIQDVVIPPVYDRSQLNNLFSAFRPVAENLTVTAGVHQVVTAAGGTRLTFYPHSFKDAAGHTITSGTVNIAITEMYKPGDVIANRATTNSNYGLLVSGGQIKLKATKAGQEVFANKYGVAFARPGYSAQRMVLYYGNTNNADSLARWTVSDTTAGMVALGTVYDSMLVGAPYSYPFDSCTSFNWINCDYFTSYSPVTTISVTPTDTTFNCSNTEVFLVFPGINAVASANTYDPYTYTFSSSMMPVGLSVDVVVIANIGGNYYYYQEIGVPVTTAMTFHPVMAPHTLGYIQSALAAL